MVETKKLKRIFENIENYEGYVKSFVKGTFNKNKILGFMQNFDKKLAPMTNFITKYV